MKKKYLLSVGWLRQPYYWLLLLLLALPGLSIAQTVTLTANSTDNPQDFGSVAVGTTSASKAYTVSASGLMDDITFTIPPQFEGSTNNSSFGLTSITLSPDGSGTIASTIIYVRFKPTRAGTFNRTFSAPTQDASQNQVTVTSAAISLTGVATTGSPTIAVNPAALGFGNQTVGTTSSPMSVTVTGTSLTADITATAPAGFLISNGGAYASSVTLPQTNGTVNATLNVEFAPTSAQNYVANVTLTSTGATGQTMSVSGTGVAPTPVLTVSATSLPDFGQTAVNTTSSVTGSFTVSGQNLQGSVTITPPTGFRIRTGTAAFSTSAVVLTPTSGTLASTTIDVRFTPTAVQKYAAALSLSTPNGNSTVTQSVSVTGEGIAGSTNPSLMVDPGALSFGAITSSGSPSTLTFDVSGTSLTSDVVLTPSVSTVQIRNASTGGVFSSDPITLSRDANGTVAVQTIEVQIVATVARGDYNAVINVASGTVASPISVTATNNSGAVSDISVVNPSRNDFTFVTRPTTISASQSFLVSATNLLRNLTVAPNGPNASYFQVSTDNVNFSSQLTFTPVDGNVTQQTIYVRFVPGNDAVTVSANIRSSSAPAPIGDISVTGISQPTIRLSDALGAFGSIVKGTTSASKTVRLDGFLLVDNVDVRFPDDMDDPARNPQYTPQFEFSLDGGTTYVKAGSIPLDASGNFTRTMQVRYAPVRVGNAVQTMEFRNASFNNGSSSYFTLASGLGQASGSAIAVEPTAQSIALITRAAGSTTATVTFTLNNAPAGTAYGANRLVIASTVYRELPSTLFPADRQSFNPGNTSGGAYVFGSGDAIDAANNTNTYVVFNGASSNFAVTNLDPNLIYYFYGFEFNNDGVTNAENYLLPSNQSLSPLPVELVSFTAQRSGQQVNLNWITASEKNSRSFDVERSADGQAFTAILSKAAQGNSSTRTSYEAVDRKPLTSLSYYRLKQIDLDGTVAYSPVVVVQGSGSVEIGIYPNPTAGKVTVSLPATLAASAPKVRISDLMGRVIQELALPANGEVDMSALPAGTYLFSIGGQQVRTRIVKY